MSSLKFLLITDALDMPIIMLLKEICQDLQILNGTWPSGQLMRALDQVHDSHLFKCHHPLGQVHGLVTQPSNIPDCFMP